MCGRSRQTVQPQALASAVGFDTSIPLRRACQYRRRENAHPGNAAPIAYRTASGDCALRSMRWGLVPSFTKKSEKPNFFRMFNARSETAAEKPSFRRLVGRRRGVVAFTGFYEWKKDDKGERQPYYFHYKNDRPMLFATLYDTWEQGEGGWTGSGADARTTNADQDEKQKERQAVMEEEMEKEDKGGNVMFSYAVLTIAASPRMQWLHERMPVMLGKEEAQKWLDSDDTEASTFFRDHTPYNSEDLVWHPVSKKMNNMGYEDQDCSAEIELKKPDKSLPLITSFFQKAPANPGRAGDIKTPNNHPTEQEVEGNTSFGDSKPEASSPAPKSREEKVTGKTRDAREASDTMYTTLAENGSHDANNDNTESEISGSNEDKSGQKAEDKDREAGARSSSPEAPLDLTPEEREFIFGSAQGAGAPADASPRPPAFSSRKTPASSSPKGKRQGSPSATARDKKQPRMTSFFQRS